VVVTEVDVEFDGAVSAADAAKTTIIIIIISLH